KYAAGLQAAKTGDNPVLIRIDTNSGHGASSTTKQLEQTADAYSFILYQLGVTPGGKASASSAETEKKPMTHRFPCRSHPVPFWIGNKSDSRTPGGRTPADRSSDRSTKKNLAVD